MIRLAAALAVSALLAPAPMLAGGWFSHDATPIAEARTLVSEPGDLYRASLVVPSPDGRSRLSVAMRESGSEATHDYGQVTRFHLSGPAGKAAFEYPMDVVGDILWSPDSLHVALSIYGGGTVGGHRLFIVDAAGKRDISEPILARFNAPKNCDLRESASIGAVKWLSSTRLLVAARQSHLEVCAERDRTALYEFDLVGAKIVRSFTLNEARREFPGAMGDVVR